jgi:hypothetical protein
MPYGSLAGRLCEWSYGVSHYYLLSVQSRLFCRLAGVRETKTTRGAQTGLCVNICTLAQSPPILYYSRLQKDLMGSLLLLTTCTKSAFLSISRSKGEGSYHGSDWQGLGWTDHWQALCINLHSAAVTTNPLLF